MLAQGVLEDGGREGVFVAVGSGEHHWRVEVTGGGALGVLQGTGGPTQPRLSCTALMELQRLNVQICSRWASTARGVCLTYIVTTLFHIVTWSRVDGAPGR